MSERNPQQDVINEEFNTLIDQSFYVLAAQTSKHRIYTIFEYVPPIEKEEMKEEAQGDMPSIIIKDNNGDVYRGSKTNSLAWVYFMVNVSEAIDDDRDDGVDYSGLDMEDD